MFTQLGAITFPEGLAGEIVAGIEGAFANFGEQLFLTKKFVELCPNYVSSLSNFC